MFEQYKIEPWFQLFAKQRMAEREHRYDWNRSSSRSVVNAIREKRKEYLGSDLGLTMFVHEDGKPLEKAVEALSGYLGELTAHFLEKEYDYPEQEDLCVGFFYYALQLYAYDKVGTDSFDDLIRLAELFRNDLEIMTIIIEQDLSEDLVFDWEEFLTEQDVEETVPMDFPNAVIGAVAVLLGVLKDPT